MLLEVQTFNFTLFKYKSDVKLISYYYKKYLLKFLLNINLRLCTGKGETFYGFKKKGKEVETKKDESKEVEFHCECCHHNLRKFDPRKDNDKDV